MHFSKAILLFAGTSVAVPLVGLGVTSGDHEIQAAVERLHVRAVTTSSVKPASTPAAAVSTKPATSSVKPASTPVAAVSSKPASTPAAAASSAKPASSAAPAASGSKSSSAAPASGSSAAGLTAAQGKTVITDLTNFDNIVLKAITALNAFTGGANITAQAMNVATAGNNWQASTVTVLTDVKALANKGKFQTADSSSIATLLSGAITTDLVKIFNVLKDKKSLFAQVNSVKNVFDGLLVLVSEFQDISEYLIPMLLSNDLGSLQTASSKVNPAAIAAINAYAN